MSRDARLLADLDAHLKGDREATARLIEGLRGPITQRIGRILTRRYAPAHQRTPEIVEELVQDTFLALFRRGSAALRTFDSDGPLSLRLYVARIASRQTNNHLDRRWSRKRGGRDLLVPSEPWALAKLPAADEGATPEARSEAQSLACRVEGEILARLSAQGQVAWRALFVEELDTAEASLYFGGKRANVHTWRRRIRKTAVAVLLEEGLVGAAPLLAQAS